MTPLPELLADLEGRLAAYGAPVAARLRPGLASDEIRTALAGAGLAPHDDLVAWWGWHDGAELDPSPHPHGPGVVPHEPENTLAGGWCVLSLEEALAQRRSLRETHDELGIGDLVLPGWVPVLDTDGTLCADTAAAGAAPLHWVAEGYLGGEPAHLPSLAAFVGLVLRAFDEDLIVPSRDDPRVPDFDAPALPPELRPLCWW